MTAPEAASALRCTPGDLRAMSRRGKLRPLRGSGGKLLFDREAVRELALAPMESPYRKHVPPEGGGAVPSLPGAPSSAKSLAAMRQLQRAEHALLAAAAAAGGEQGQRLAMMAARAEGELAILFAGYAKHWGDPPENRRPRQADPCAGLLGDDR